jgi:hypothetical protein
LNGTFEFQNLELSYDQYIAGPRSTEASHHRFPEAAAGFARSFARTAGN